jgi:CSLREA domain-containing protein
MRSPLPQLKSISRFAFVFCIIALATFLLIGAPVRSGLSDAPGLVRANDLVVNRQPAGKFDLFSEAKNNNQSELIAPNESKRKAPPVPIKRAIGTAVGANEIIAAKSQTPLIKYQSGRGLQTENIENVLRSDGIDLAQTQPLALATDDFNGDGFPDLVCAYALPYNGGFLLIYYGDESAFAPQGGEALQNIIAQRFPTPFRAVAVIKLDDAPDFLFTGDFDRDSRKDILTAAKNGQKLNFLVGDGHENFAAESISLPEGLTALTAGDKSLADGYADVIVGTSGANLLIFEAMTSILNQQPSVYQLPAAADSVVLGQLDDDSSTDLAVIAGGQIYLQHGGERPSPERIELPFAVKTLTIGDFIWDRDSRMELAIAADDGSLKILSRGALDTRPLTTEELRSRRQLVADVRDGKRPAANLRISTSGDATHWKIAEETAVQSSLTSDHSQPLLTAVLASGQQSVDLLTLNPAARQINISYRTDGILYGADGLRLAPQAATRKAVSFADEGEPIAVLPMRLNLHSRPSLVVLQKGRLEPALLFFAPTTTFMVTKTADTSDGACNADCSLREAVIAANAAGGADMITFAAGLNGLAIQLTRTGDDNTASNGDLDINDDLTITGNGAANTIIQGSSNASFTSNMGDKAIGINQDGSHTTLNVTLSGLTVRFTRNDIAVNGNFTQTGGAMDIFLTGGGAMPGPTTTVTNCTFDSNANSHSYGGGINIDSGAGAAGTGIYRGTVQMTGCTISNNKTLSTSLGDNPPAGGGLNLFADRHNVTFTNCTITGNQTSLDVRANGGGINMRHSNGGTITLNNTAVNNNTAGSDGGGIITVFVQTVSMTGGSITGNTAQGSSVNSMVSESADGGGFFSASNVGVSTALSGVTISNNTATAGSSGRGGGVEDISNSPLNLTNCTITGNSADSGGGVATTAIGTNQTTTLNGCSISGNTATTGNGVYVSAGIAAFSNTNTVSGDITVAAGGIPTLTGNDGSTINLTGNLSLANTSGTFNGNSSVFTITGNFSQSGGTFNGNSGTINLTGNFSFSGGTFNGGTGTFNFNGSSAQSLGGTSAATFNNLTINNAAGVNLGNNETVGNTLTLTSGALAVGTNTLTLNNLVSVTSGSLTSSATGTVNYNKSSNAQSVILANYGNLTFSNFTKSLPSSGTVKIAGTFTTGVAGGHTVTGSTVEFNGTSAQTLPAGFTTYNNLTLNNAAGVTGFAGLTVQNLLRVAAGTFTSSSTYKDVQIDSGATLAGVNATTINVSGSWTNNGTFTANGNTVIFNGSATQNLVGSSATTFNNLTINNVSGVILGNNATVGGALTLTNGVFAASSNTLTLNGAVTTTGGSLSSNSNGTVNYNQGSNGQVVLAASYGNLTFSNFNKTLPNSGTLGIVGVFTAGSATGHTITGSTINFNGAGSQTIPAFTYNNLTSSNSGARTLAASGIIKIASAFTPGSNTYTITGSTVEYNGAAAQTLPSAFTTYNNLTLNNAGGTTGFAGLTVQGLIRVQAGTFTSSSTYKDVQIDSGATLAATAASTIDVSGNWTNNGTFTPNTGTVNFNGGSTQTVSGSATNTFNNLTINNANGVTLNADITINATLTLTSGALAIGSRTLTLNNALTITGGSFSSNANGTVNYNQSTNGQNVAPGNYGNLTFSNFTKTMPSSGTIKIAGTFTTGAAGGHTITGSTVEFNGSSAQAIPANFTIYNNLTLNNAAGVTGFAGLTVQGLLRIQQGTFTSSSTYKDVQIDSGATLAGVNATTINISGSWTNNGTFTANGNTVVFNGGAAQALSGATTFNNLTINNASGVNLGASTYITVGGTLTLTSGAFAVGDNTLSLNGAATVTGGSLTSNAGGTVNYNQSSNGQAVLVANYGNLTFSNFTKTLPSSGTIKIAGTFTTGAAGGHTVTGSTVEFNGTSAQTLPAGFTTYNNLTSNNAAGLVLGGNLTVNGALTLTSGNVTTNANVLSVASAGSSSRTSGHVIGNLKKTFGGVGAFLYHVGTANGYSPVNASITAGTGDLTVKAVQGAHPSLQPAKALQRYWTLTATGLTADLQMSYLDPTDIMGDESIYRIIRLTAGVPSIFPNGCPAPPCVDGAANTMTLAGVTSFADFAAGEPSSPTAIEMETMAATGYEGGTLIEWRTGDEVDNLGFNVYREEAGKRVAVNREIVAGSALVAGSGVRFGAGRAYAWWDGEASGKAFTQYWLEAVDLDGSRTLHGPVLVKAGGSAPHARSSAAMLSQVGNPQSAVTQPIPITAPFTLTGPGQTDLINPFAGQAAVKIAIKHDGFYRISGAELIAAGFDPKADPEKVQLYADGRQLPIKVVSDNPGLITAVEFYGVGLDSASTDSRVYWLVAGDVAGRRNTEVTGAGFARATTSFLTTVERKDRTIYFSALRNGERENFFGAVIAGDGVEQTLMLRNVDEAASAQATVEVTLQGVTRLQHRVSVYVNAAYVGEVQFDGQEQGISKFAIQPSQLREGENRIRLLSQGGAGDVSLVDVVRVSYWHTFAADNDTLRLTASGGQSTTVSGFSSAAVRVFDVTDPDAVEEVSAKVEARKSGYAATFATSRTGERRLLALTDDKADRSGKLSTNEVSRLRTPNHAASLVIITRRDFFTAFDSLAALRAGQGIKTELIDIEDIYDEFSFGNKSPQALKDFLRYAKANWKVAPQYVLLGADSSFDAKNYLGFGDWDIAPAKLLDTALMETASDDWFVDFNNDGLPEMAIGRLPVRTVEEAAAVVGKLIAYEAASPSEEVLLVADINDTFNFEAATADLRKSIPASLRVTQLNRGQVDPATARSRLLEALNRGPKVINYTGHGSQRTWRGNLLTGEDAGGLENREHLSLFVMMSCLNGYSHDPERESLAKALLKAEQGGAVAVWSSSGMTEPEAQAEMNRALYRLMFSDSSRNLKLGDLLNRAKTEIGDQDVRRTWIFLGDPTMKLR